MRATTWHRRPLLRSLAIAVLLAAAATAASAAPAQAATLPYVPLDHWSTEFIVEAAERGLLPGLSLGDRPYRRVDVERALREERALADSDLEPIWERVRSL